MPGQRTASWSDIMAKAKRLILEGDVSLHRNGYNNIAATVQGDHGNYQVEIGRDDPKSRVITTWQCSCPWSQFAWDRTGIWKQYEGRSCSHTLAAFWKALATPLDEDADEDQRSAPGTKQGPAGWGLTPAPTPDTDTRTFDPDQPTIGDELQDPDDPSINQPNQLDQNMMQLQQQEPQQFEFQSPYEQQLVKQFPNLFSSTDDEVGRRKYGRIHFGGGSDFERIRSSLYPDILGTNRVEPTVQVINQNGVTGELRGGKIPMPDAMPIGESPERSPVFNWKDLGYDPDKGMQMNPRSDGPEERGRHGIIPMGSKATAVDIDPQSGQVCIVYYTDGYKLHHRLIKTWVDGKDVKMVSSRVPPYRQRRR